MKVIAETSTRVERLDKLVGELVDEVTDKVHLGSEVEVLRVLDLDSREISYKIYDPDRDLFLGGCEIPYPTSDSKAEIALRAMVKKLSDENEVVQ